MNGVDTYRGHHLYPTHLTHIGYQGSSSDVFSGGTREIYSAGSSVGSSSSDSSRGTCRNEVDSTFRKTSRFRTVHLKRSSGCPTFGFSFRGGREFGTGFFISVVELGSEAHLKGVKVGDQIVRINGLSVENATHQEILQLAQHHHHLTLSLKNVGLIPVKDKCEDPLTWRLVEQPLDPSLLTGICDVDRILIDAPEGAKLGCGICKGPDWRPGIFVQYTKPGSLARQAGLQPGDQILQCNKVSFTNIDFAFAVTVLKGIGTLDLIVRKGSGIDLFPGESSGYSSASSTADEAVTVPPVRKNESSLARSNGNHPVSPPSNGRPTVSPPTNGRHPVSPLANRNRENGSLVAGKRSTSVDDSATLKIRKPSKAPPPPPCPPPPLKSSGSLDCLLDGVKSRSKEKTATVTLRQECRYGGQTVVQISGGSCPVQVEVHQSEPPSLSSLENSSGTASISSQASLSSAISQELQRRKEKQQQNGESILEKCEKPRKPTEGQTKEHDLLIAELKKRQDNRMAAYQQTAPIPSRPQCDSPDSLESPPPCPTPDYSDTSDSPPPSHTVKSSILRFEEKTKKKSVTFGGSQTKEITPNKKMEGTWKREAPRSDVNGNLQGESGIKQGGISARAEYNGNVVESTKIIGEAKLEDVEMHSIDNQELVQPKPVPSLPPPTYFKPPSRKDLSDSPKRTTVIKITEYTGDSSKPAKFEFIKPKAEVEETFESELAKTLSRVQLKKVAETSAEVVNNVNTSSSAEATSKYGTQGSIPVQTISQDELSSVKKALRTFEKNASTNTIFVQIPKRNT